MSTISPLWSLGICVLTLLLLVAIPAMAAAPQCAEVVCGPFSAAFNFPADLSGTPDTRPCCWGFAGVQAATVVFQAPVGYRVRVLRVEGSYMAAAHGAALPDGSRAVYRPGNRGYASWGLLTTEPSGSSRVNLAADNCFAWLAYAVGNGEVNQPFVLDTHVGGLLGPDNAMIVEQAVFLNDQAIPIHQEVTFVLTYAWER